MSSTQAVLELLQQYSDLLSDRKLPFVVDGGQIAQLIISFMQRHELSILWIRRIEEAADVVIPDVQPLLGVDLN